MLHSFPVCWPKPKEASFIATFKIKFYGGDFSIIKCLHGQMNQPHISMLLCYFASSSSKNSEQPLRLPESGNQLF